MTRFALAVAVLGFVFPLAARPVDAPKAAPASKPEESNGTPVYVKFLWPVDLDTGNEKDRPAVESWVSKSVEKRFKANYIAVSEWVPLVEKRYEATDIWDGKLDGKERACAVSAVIAERKDGLIKVVVRGWDPGGSEVTLTLADEPGSREVAPVSESKTQRAVPHVAVFIGAPAK
jgi:hypothetical protein